MGGIATPLASLALHCQSASLGLLSKSISPTPVFLSLSFIDKVPVGDLTVNNQLEGVVQNIQQTGVKTLDSKLFFFCLDHKEFPPSWTHATQMCVWGHFNSRN